MSGKVHYFTEEGLEKVKAELAHMISVERPAISKAIAEARDKGDLSRRVCGGQFERLFAASPGDG